MGWRRRRRQPEESVEGFLDSEFLVLADVRLASDDEDTPFLPAFTSKETLHRFEPGASDPIPLRGSNVLLLLLEPDYAGVVINPGEPDCSTISRSGAEELVDSSYEALWSGPKILLASPDEPPPPTLLNAFRTACERDPTVAAAYLVLAAAPGGEALPRTVLGIQLSSGDETERRADRFDQRPKAHPAGRRSSYAHDLHEHGHPCIWRRPARHSPRARNPHLPALKLAAPSRRGSGSIQAVSVASGSSRVHCDASPRC